MQGLTPAVGAAKELAIQRFWLGPQHVRGGALLTRSTSTWGRLAALFCVALLSLGCGLITVVETPSPSATLTGPSAEAHDLAVTAVSFVPEGIDGTKARRGGLLAVVENRGRERATGVRVTASLYGPTKGELLAQEEATIDMLVAGESQVIIFPEVQGLPLRTRYSLTVEVQPVAGETRLQNNARTFELDVSLTGP